MTHSAKACKIALFVVFGPFAVFMLVAAVASVLYLVVEFAQSLSESLSGDAGAMALTTCLFAVVFIGL